jgi:hypothetical protein
MVVKFEVYHDGEQWCARGVGADIFTCAPTLDQLTEDVKDAAACHFADDVAAGRPLSVLLLAEAEVSGVAQVTAS